MTIRLSSSTLGEIAKTAAVPDNPPASYLFVIAVARLRM